MNKKIFTKILFSLILSTTYLSCNLGIAMASDENKEKDLLKNIRQLTFEGEKSGEAYFSPNGKKIIFQSIRNNNKFYQIYTMNSDGSEIKMVSTGRGKTTCAYFSPNGKHIIFASSHLDPNSEKEEENKGKSYKWDFEKSLDIFQAEPDGSALKQLTASPGYDAEGTFSNNGKKIVFTSQRDDDLELYIMDSDGKNQKRLTNYKGYDGGAFFSPDDKKILYRRFDDKGNAQIMLINADGTGEKQLTNSQAINWCPSFSPDGKHIIFSSNVNDPRNFELFIMDINGEHLRQMTFNKGTDILPIFSPDGKKIMWTSTRTNSKSQVFIADFNNELFNDSAKYSKNLYSDLKYLSSDGLEGRRAGTPGADKAAEYIAGQFKKIGLKPGGEQNKSYFQDFDVTVGISSGTENTFTVKNLLNTSGEGSLFKDFTPLSFSENAKISGQIVFAGYGITATEHNYDDYKDIDVNGKIVLVLRHEPQEKNEKSLFNGNKPTPYSELRYKAFNAKRHGAAAIILINGAVNYSEPEDELLPLRTFGGTGNVGIPMIQVKNNFIEQIFRENSLDMKNIQLNIDENLKPNSFLLKNEIALSVDLKRDMKSTRNVIGYIEGKDKGLKNEVIIIGASGVIELARLIEKKKLNRTVVFMAFSGEELGLLGSSYFMANSNFKNIIAMINMDMIGRLDNEKLYIGGIKTADNFNNIINQINKKYKFDLSFFNDGYGPSDHMSFYLKNIPVLFFFTGIHGDYHRPSDDLYKINFPGMNKVINFIEETFLKIDNNSEKPKLVKIAPDPHMGSVSSGKKSGAYLGTIPDYTSMNSSNGVKLSGVREGSPAEKGGLKGGDIIIKFDNIKINTLYDYTFAIQGKKPGDKAQIVVTRDGLELSLELIVGKK